MEDLNKPHQGSDHGKESGIEPDREAQQALGGQTPTHETGAKKSYKRFLLINGIVVGVIILISSILFSFMIPRLPEKSLAEENSHLKAEIKRLQATSARFMEKSKEELRIEDLITKVQPRIGPSIVDPIARAIVKYAQAYDLPPELILSIINNTSRFEITAESAYGSVGLMHISPKIYRNGLQELGITEQQAFHIDNNIHLGCMILRQLRDQGRSMEVAIAALIGSERMVDGILVGFANSMILNNKTMDQFFPGKGSGPAEDLAHNSGSS